MRTLRALICVGTLTALAGPEARADVTLFSTGAPDGLMATASRPDTGGVTEIESGDDFIANTQFHLTGATFTGLIVPNPNGGTPTIGQVVVEIYRVFPNDSNAGRTITVPTRANSPSDVELADRDSSASNLTFSTTQLNARFTAANSVLNGIHPSPGQQTNGEGPVTGAEVQFNVSFTTPLDLPPDHYFFVPQVQVANGGTFYWLSAPRPVTGQFAFAPDLQSWIRNDALAPDWLRVGTDIVGGATPPTFNASFSLTGVPEPSSIALLGLGATALAAGARRARRRPPARAGRDEFPERPCVGVAPR